MARFERGDANKRVHNEFAGWGPANRVMRGVRPVKNRKKREV